MNAGDNAAALLMEAEEQHGPVRQRLAVQRTRDGELAVYGVQRHAGMTGRETLVAYEMHVARNAAEARDRLASIGKTLEFPQSLIALARTRLRAALRSEAGLAE